MKLMHKQGASFGCGAQKMRTTKEVGLTENSAHQRDCFINTAT